MWDESSYALNAQEMLEKGNPIEVYLLGKPDLYNSKPPFAIWCMAFWIKILGFNELGVRMASAVFSLFSALLLWLIGIKLTNNKWMALMLPMILLSSYGFVGEHVSRTGDTDSILTFWILLQSIFLFAYTNSERDDRSNLYLMAFGIALSFGCLTKGIAGLIVLPGAFAWLLYTGKLKQIFRYRGFYIAILSFLILVVGYYLLRNYLTPGYWQAVLNNEIGGRLQRQDFLNQKTLPFYLYFDLMISHKRYFIWIFVLPLSLIYILTRKSDPRKKMGIFFIFIFTSIATLLALSKTKLEWYDAPLYPMMAAIIGISFCLLMEKNEKVISLLFVCIFCWPYFMVISRNLDAPKNASLRNVLRLIRSGGRKDSIHIINSNPNYTIYFYAKKDKLAGNYCEVVTQDDPSLNNGSFILTLQYERDVDVHNMFHLQPVLSYKECSYYRILSKK
jgi:4-amino-4-deoxy-L-arabinose transferase-like glycosyltransferase